MSPDPFPVVSRPFDGACVVRRLRDDWDESETSLSARSQVRRLYSQDVCTCRNCMAFVLLKLRFCSTLCKKISAKTWAYGWSSFDLVGICQGQGILNNKGFCKQHFEFAIIIIPLHPLGPIDYSLYFSGDNFLRYKFYYLIIYIEFQQKPITLLSFWFQQTFTMYLDQGQTSKRFMRRTRADEAREKVDVCRRLRC